MPVKKGDKRGPYRQGPAQDVDVEAWDKKAKEHFAELFDASTLEVDAVRRSAAERAAEIDRRLRQLRDQPLLVAEEHDAVKSYTRLYERWLTILGVTATKRKRSKAI